MPSVNATLRKAESLIKKRKFTDAKAHYLAVLEQFPENPQAKQGLQALSQHQTASQPATLAPPKEQINALITLYNNSQHQEVIQQATEFTKRYPNSAVLFNLIGLAHAGLQQQDKAVHHFKKAINHHPNDIATHNNLANVLIDLGKLDQAIMHLEKALHINPNFACTYNTLGIALTEIGNIEGAFNAFNNALKINPDDAEIYFNLGNLALTARCTQAESFKDSSNLLSDRDYFDKALTSFNKATSLSPDYVEAWFRKSLVLLVQGNFEIAWKAYEWRWKENFFALNFLKTRKPLWHSGQKNSRVLIWPEQGIGDEIMFGSLLPIMSAFTKDIHVQIDKRLLPLFKRSMPTIHFYPKDIPIDELSYDAHLPMGSMGHYCLQGMEDFQKIIPHYLSSNIEHTTKLRKEIGIKNIKTIGISWQTNNSQSSHLRSLALMDFISPFKDINVQLVSLQYGDVRQEIAEIKQTLGIDIYQHPEINNFNDIDGLASLIDICDLVVSIDNSTVHLAGALGKPTWVLLPIGSDWRWFLDRNDSPWYPSLQLFRQKIPRNWTPVLEEIKNKLYIKYQL